MSYLQSQQNRQAILDHLHADPFKSAAQLAEALGITRNSAQSAVKFMMDRGEIAKLGKGKSVRYKAIATTTISAAEVVREMQDKRAASQMGKTEERSSRVHAPWITRSCDIRDPFKDGPIKGQGGQGAIRRPWGIQSSMA